MNDTKKVCLVTGASSGIGFGIAGELHKNGYRVVATARRRDRLLKLGLSPEDIHAGDLTDLSFMKTLEDYVFNTCDHCDYLFNCAGSITVGTIDEMDLEKMSRMIRLNIEATFQLTYSFLKQFKKQGYGHIVNISSVLGTKVRATAGAYAATKFAIEALSEALRLELTGTDIQVTCIEPGLVMTELHKDWPVHPREGMNIKDPLEVKNIVDAVNYIMDQPAHVRIPKLMILPKDHNI